MHYFLSLCIFMIDLQGGARVFNVPFILSKIVACSRLSLSEDDKKVRKVKGSGRESL